MNVKFVTKPWREIASFFRQSMPSAEWESDEKQMSWYNLNNTQDMWICAVAPGPVDADLSVVVAVLKFHCYAGFGVLNHLYVEPDYRNKGIANGIVDYAKGLFMNAETPKLLTATVIFNSHAHLACHKAGFGPISEKAPVEEEEIVVGWMPS